MKSMRRQISLLIIICLFMQSCGIQRDLDLTLGSSSINDTFLLNGTISVVNKIFPSAHAQDPGECIAYNAITGVALAQGKNSDGYFEVSVPKTLVDEKAIIELKCNNLGTLREIVGPVSNAGGTLDLDETTSFKAKIKKAVLENAGLKTKTVEEIEAVLENYENDSYIASAISSFGLSVSGNDWKTALKSHGIKPDEYLEKVAAIAFVSNNTTTTLEKAEAFAKAANTPDCSVGKVTLSKGSGTLVLADFIPLFHASEVVSYSQVKGEPSVVKIATDSQTLSIDSATPGTTEVVLKNLFTNVLCTFVVTMI